MQIILLFLFISQNLTAVLINHRAKHFAKRDVHSSAVQNLNRYVKTYETGHKIILATPNFTSIDSLLSAVSTNRLKPFVRDHTTWIIRQIPSNTYREIARYDSMKNCFILDHYDGVPCQIDVHTGQLTVINTADDNLLYTEMIMHGESGLSKGDDILHDIYRFVRLSTTSLNCSTNVTVNLDESTEITCSIEYEFVQYDDLDNYQPMINFTFYIKQNDSSYTSLDPESFTRREDLPTDHNTTLNWKRSISYTIRSIDRGDSTRDYVCIVIPDTLQGRYIFLDNHRVCRIRINVRNNHSSTVIFTRLNQWNLIDILIMVLIILSSLLFILSLILCWTARQYNRKRTVQIKPENKTTALPLGTKRTFSKENLFSNNNEMKSEIPLLSSQQVSDRSIKTLSSYQHKPGCPKYIPSPEYNLLSSDLFTHTTIDNIKKIILPDIPETHDLFDDQTYIHFYIPSKSEHQPMTKVHSSSFEQNISAD